MQYRKFGNLGMKVSALGFGAMRLPTVEMEDGKKVIDETEAIRMIRHAIDEGLNYLDTAYPYHDGQSEVLCGKALQDGYRKKVYLATKCPVWKMTCPEDFDKILDEQLGKLQTDYIDCYLLHSLDADSFENIVLPYHLIEKAEEAKAAGKIRHIGFSFHDDKAAFKKIVDSSDKWEFCQIQMNYIDVNRQATLEGMEYAAEKGLGVIIMEPLLGGKLAVPEKHIADALPDRKTPVEWALDFLWNRPEVSLLLSGMSDAGQVEQNLEYADRSYIGMLSKEDEAMLAGVKKLYDTMALVPCTKCRYCMPCPFGLDIPGIFEAYNKTAVSMRKARELYSDIKVKADACRSCHRCEKACPQHIVISEKMKKAAAKLTPKKKQ